MSLVKKYSFILFLIFIVKLNVFADDELPISVASEINKNMDELMTDLISLECEEKKHPIQHYRGKSKQFLEFSLKNDLFAAPITVFRNTIDGSEFIIFDQGETHGIKFKLGNKLGEKNLTLDYSSNLYTDLVNYIKYGDKISQHFTSAQKYSIRLDNMETLDLFTYNVQLGGFSLIRDNDDNVWLASTQQKELHNGLDEKILGLDYYNIHNVKRDQNEFGAFTNIDLGLSHNSLNKSKTIGSNVRIFVAPELYTITEMNNAKFGVEGILFFTPIQQDLPIIADFKIPKNFLAFKVGGGLNGSLHQVKNDNNDQYHMSTSFKPKTELGLKLGPVEISYLLEANQGTLPNYIEENKIYPVRTNKDLGDQGQTTIRINGEF